jgi:hypothetical protein
VGDLIVNAVLRRDYPVIQGALLVIAAIYVVINFAIDLLYGGRSAHQGEAMLTLLARLFRRRIVLAAALMLKIAHRHAGAGRLGVLGLRSADHAVLDRLQAPAPRTGWAPTSWGAICIARHPRRALFAVDCRAATLGSVLVGTLLGLVAGFSAGWTGR